MDDLKLIVNVRKSSKDGYKYLKTSLMISIWNLDLKCSKIAFKRDKVVHSQNLVIDINREIQELEQGKT